MKKILVTGASGFVGNYVVSELLRQGNEVIATSFSQEKARESIWFKSVNYLRFDMATFDPQVDYYDFFDKPDAVIHLSWSGLPNYKSLFHFEINLPLHYGFIKNLVANGCKDITVAGTCFEYGMMEGVLDESIATVPANPYALAKDSLNKFLTELIKVQPFVLKWVRLFYLYGDGQHPNSLFSQLDEALKQGKEFFNMSGGEQVRDYLPIDLAASYLVKIALQDRITGTINCCSGHPVTVRDLVKYYLEKRGVHIKLNLGYYDYPDYEPMSFWGSNQKLQKILNEQ